MTIRLRGTGRAFTGRVQGLWSESADDVSHRTWMTYAPIAAASRRYGEAIRHAAGLSAREDEGGATRSIE
jgi:hypothetical protein